jgi:hypothetical protein
MRATAHRREEFRGRRSYQLDVVVPAEHHESGRDSVGGLTGRIESAGQRGSLRDSRSDAR